MGADIWCSCRVPQPPAGEPVGSRCVACKGTIGPGSGKPLPPTVAELLARDYSTAVVVAPPSLGADCTVPADIVQVIDRLLGEIDEASMRYPDVQADIARLRELRDHIERDRECQDAWVRLCALDDPLDKETVDRLRELTNDEVHRERALLALCRERSKAVVTDTTGVATDPVTVVSVRDGYYDDPGTWGLTEFPAQGIVRCVKHRVTIRSGTPIVDNITIFAEGSVTLERSASVPVY